MRVLSLLLLSGLFSGCGDAPDFARRAEAQARCPDDTVWACVAKLPCEEPNPCGPDEECARLDPIQGVFCTPQEPDE